MWCALIPLAAAADYAETAEWSAEGAIESVAFSGPVAGIGDINGDGYADVALSDDTSVSIEQSTWIYHGSSVGLGSGAATIPVTDVAGNPLGYVPAAAGDVDGDGYDDLVVGAQSWEVPEAYLYRGGALGVSATVATILSEGDVGGFGWAVAGAGDVDADGFDDVVVGASGTSADNGAFYLYHGSAYGLATDAATAIVGVSGDGNLGWSVDGAGDVDADGFADVIVGGYGYSESVGRAQVCFGGSAGVTRETCTALTSPDASQDFGAAVAGVGDVDSDGYSDFAVTDGRNYAYLYRGASGGVDAPGVETLDCEGEGECARTVDGGDFDGDGYADIVVTGSSSSSSGTLWIYWGGPTGVIATSFDGVGAEWGVSEPMQLSTAGDVDADGYDDLLVGQDLVRALYRGDFLGPDTADQVFATQSAGYFGRYLAITDLDGDGRAEALQWENDVLSVQAALSGPSSLTTVRTFADLGGPAGGRGDINGDGVDDLVARGYGSDGGPTLDVYFGGADADWTSPDQVLENPGSYETFVDELVFAGDIDGDGIDDIVSGTGYESYTAGSLYVYLGSDLGIVVSDSMLGSDESFAATIRPVGDLDNDGYADIVLSEDGTMAVYRGGPDGLSHTPSVRYDVSSGEAAGVDLDQDGYGELLVAGEGEVTVYAGSADGPAACPLMVVETEGMWGGTLLAPGDMDQDGYPDVLVQTSWDSYTVGTVALFHGSPSGLATAGAHRYAEGVVGEYFGYAMAAGDIDGDGWSEVLIGALNYDDGRGKSWLYAGADPDADGDGARLGHDCDDADATRHPAAVEVDCESSVDLNCDGYSGVGDADGDGFAACEECDDGDPAVFPGAVEVPGDSLDQDCDGVELCYVDADGDGYAGDTVAGSSDIDCRGGGYSSPGEDVDDTDATVTPCVDFDGDGVRSSEDCDDHDAAVGAETAWYADADGDGYTAADDTVSACTAPTGYGAATDLADCDDLEAAIHPSAEDVPGDGVDQDCDGTDASAEAADTANTPDPDDPADDPPCGCRGGSAWIIGLVVTTRRRIRRGRLSSRIDVLQG